MIQPLPMPSPAALRAALQAASAPHSPRLVECALADFSAQPRGKRVAAADFVAMAGCRLPSVVFGLTLTSGEPEAVFGPLLPKTYDDMRLLPDLATLRPSPGRPGEVTVIVEPSGDLPSSRGMVEASACSPRAALRAVLESWQQEGLAATVAPELEFFLIRRDAGSGALRSAASRLQAPTAERACEAFSLERLAHFDPWFDDLYAACDTLGIPINGHAHESALSQFEVNFRPGEPLAQADAVWRFKRLARELAHRHGFLCSFAPKPFLGEPGVGMHWHVSVQRPDPLWPHHFAYADGRDSPALAHFAGGLQRGAAAAMALFSPHDMGFDRIALSNASPTEASWGAESRSLAFRVPESGPTARRLENRLPGGDANPYLTLAAMLGLGLDGLRRELQPLAPGAPALRLPESLPEALDALEASDELAAWLGRPLVELYVAVKRHEHAERAALIDPRADWDLTHLLELA